MIEYRLFAQRIGLVGVTNLLSSISGILLVPILTKNVPAGDYGIWAQINVTIGLLSTVVLLGLTASMIRFLASEKSEERIKEDFYSIFVLIIFTSLISSLAVFLFSEPIARILFNGNLAVTRLLPLLFFIEPLNGILFNFFRTFQQIKKHSLFIVTNTYLSIIFVAYFVLSGHGIYGAVVGLVITRYLLFLAMLAIVILEIGIRVPIFLNIREFLRFGLPAVPQGLASWTVNSSDRYFISFFLGTAFVGFYSPGYLLGNMINVFAAPLAFLLPALLSRYYDSNNLEKVGFILGYSLKYFLAVAIPSAVGLSLLSKPMLAVLSTPQIASQGYLITPFTAISSLLLGVLVIISNIILLEKKTPITSAIWIIAALLNVALNSILVPHVGITGAASAALATFLFIFILTTYYSFKYFPFPIDKGFVLKSIFASGVMSLIIARWTPVGLFQIIILVVICAIAYFIVLVLLGGFKREEIAFFSEILKKY
ncbi:MAG: oligosaccharide flippase family protein [Methanotrichaceae archaeon]